MKCGASYANLNNTATNANWNIGASHSYPKLVYLADLVNKDIHPKCFLFSLPLGKNQPESSNGLVPCGTGVRG